MKKHSSVTAFYLETLLLVAVFVSVLLVLTNVFGLSRAQSARARRLNAAVTLAQNAAEAFAADSDPEALAAALDPDGTAADIVLQDSNVTVRYDEDLLPDPAGAFSVTLSLWSAERPAGLMAYAQITVRDAQSGDAVYTLDTAQYRKEVP